MSGVQISGEIVPFATAVPAYPVFQDVNGKGGYYAGVADIPGRDAILASFRKEGMLVYVAKTKCIYALLPDLTNWIIIANVNLGAQAVWYIDPGNSSGTASDNNDGLTAATALLTGREFCSRCFPGGQQLVVTVAAVNINILATSAQTIPMMFMNFANGLSTLALVDVFINCGISSSAAITLATVTQINATTNTRGRLTTAAGTFVNKERIRVTSGAALGAVCYSMGLTSALDTFITCPGKDVSTTVSYPAPGDTVVVDTLLVTINRLEIQTGVFTRATVTDAKVVKAVLRASDQGQYAGAGNGITMKGCQPSSTGGIWAALSGACYLNCRIPATGRTSFFGSNVLFVNHVVQGIMTLGNGSFYTAGLFIDSGNVLVGQGDNFTHPGMTALTKLYVTTNFGNVGAIEAENGPGPLAASAAIQIDAGAIVQNDSFATEMWGVSGGYPIAFQILPLGWLYFSNNPIGGVILSTFMKIAATVAMKIGGVNYAYSNSPVVMRSLSCGIVVDPSSAITTENYVNLTGQVAAIGATALLTANLAVKGTFRFRGYIAPTVAGAAGNLVLNAIYTDESGTLQTTPVCTINNAVLAGAGGSLELECNGTTAISYSLTGYSAGLTYNVRISLEYDSNGP